jgi:hypothetical protein
MNDKIILTPEHAQRLTDTAQREGVSINEINQRAIDLYFELDEKYKVIETLTTHLKAAQKKSKKALSDAQMELRKTIQQIRKKTDGYARQSYSNNNRWHQDRK